MKIYENKMTALTTRTIRNYLKDGILKGRKIGGQWRFTEEDIKSLMDSGTFREDFTDKQKQEIIDFLDGVNTEYTEAIQTCTIVDLYQEKDILENKEKKLLEFINSPDTANKLKPRYMSFSWEYIDSEAKATLSAAPNYIIEALKILQD